MQPRELLVLGLKREQGQATGHHSKSTHTRHSFTLVRQQSAMLTYAIRYWNSVHGDFHEAVIAKVHVTQLLKLKTSSLRSQKQALENGYQCAAKYAHMTKPKCKYLSLPAAVVILDELLCYYPFGFQVGEDGRVYAAVQYPSMSELWPDIYRAKAVRVVQVSSTRRRRFLKVFLSENGTDRCVGQLFLIARSRFSRGEQRGITYHLDLERDNHARLVNASRKR